MRDITMTASRCVLLIVTVSGFAWSSLCAAAVYGPVVAAQSRIAFVSKQMGVPVNGQFRRFSAQISFDPAKPESAKARIEVDLASIDAGSREANEEVVGKDWFFAKNFPVAVFEAQRVKALGANRYEALGNLGIKGRTRDQIATASFRETGGLGVFEGSFILKRLDFGIGEGAWGDPGTVANEVQVNWVLTLQPQGPQGAPTKK